MAYVIVLLSIVTMIFLSVLFSRRASIHSKQQKEEGAEETAIIPQETRTTSVANNAAWVKDDLFNLDDIVDADGNLNLDMSDISTNGDTLVDLDFDDIYKA